jgi:serine phosphatase RsbU (regulator of sigma subunit)
MKNIVLILLIVIASATKQSIAENKHKMDSLKMELQKAKSDTVKLRIYEELCEECDVENNLTYGQALINCIDNILKQKLNSKQIKYYEKKKENGYMYLGFYYQSINDKKNLSLIIRKSDAIRDKYIIKSHIQSFYKSNISSFVQLELIVKERRNLLKEQPIIIQIKADDKLVHTMNTFTNNVIRIDSIPFGFKYTISAFSDIYAEKKFLINLKDSVDIDKDFLKKQKTNFLFEAEINLFEKSLLLTKFKNLFSKIKLLGIIRYSPTKHNLIYDENYAKKIGSHLKKIESQVNDILKNPEFIKEIDNINDSLRISKNQLLITQKENELKESELKFQKTIRFFLISGLLIVIILSFFIYLNYKHKQIANKNLEAKNILIEKQKAEVEKKNLEILDSIEYAKRIQTTILPPPKVVKKYLDDSFILYLPKDIVAGDFYWMESVGDWVLFAACDCTGHGVPGALVSVVCHNALNRAVKEYNKIMPAEILDCVAELVLENFSSDDDVKDGMDASVCALNTATGELFWAGANNPLWLVRHAELNSSPVEITEYKPNKQPIGKFDDRVPYTNNKIEITKGDTIYLFTDGYADQFGGERGKKLTKAKFKEAILNMQQLNLDEQKKYLLDLHLNYKGNLGQVDDICVIGVRV